MKTKPILPHTIFQTKSLNPKLPITSAKVTRPTAVDTTQPQTQAQTQPEPQSVAGVASNILNNIDPAYTPVLKDINDYSNHRWMKNYFDIVPEADIDNPTLKNLNYYAKNFGIDTSVSNLKKKFDNATELAYAQKNKEFQRSEDQYYQNMAAQNAQYQQGVQNAMSQALASGSSRGMQFANQFAAQNELARANATGALDLATQRNDLKAQEAEAYAKNAIDAEQTAYDRKANILGQAIADRANEVQRYAADTTLYSNDVSARLNNYQYNLDKFYNEYLFDKEQQSKFYSQLYTDILGLREGMYNADKNYDSYTDSARITGQYGLEEEQLRGANDLAIETERGNWNKDVAETNRQGQVGAAQANAAGMVGAANATGQWNYNTQGLANEGMIEVAKLNGEYNLAGIGKTTASNEKIAEMNRNNIRTPSASPTYKSTSEPTSYTREDILGAYYTAKQNGDFGRMAELEHAFPFVSNTQEYASDFVKSKIAEAKETGKAVYYDSVLGNPRYALPDGTTVTEEQYNKMKTEEREQKNKEEKAKEKEKAKAKENKNLNTKSGKDYTASKYPGL
jgi:hypothetical protein